MRTGEIEYIPWLAVVRRSVSMFYSEPIGNLGAFVVKLPCGGLGCALTPPVLPFSPIPESDTECRQDLYEAALSEAGFQSDDSYTETDSAFPDFVRSIQTSLKATK